VVAARAKDGTFVPFAVAENRHAHHILDLSLAPAAVVPALASQAAMLTREVMSALGVVGVLCVEFFLTPEGGLLVNEIAPRPHNSGHLTIEACDVSQFEAQLRAVCGLPLVVPTQRPAAMVNLLGEVWGRGEPDWTALLRERELALHLYGKAEVRPGRKMGHLTALAATPEQAAERALAARRRLQDGTSQDGTSQDDALRGDA
jgi:5-(carboxyamino)imidazole ribonucleotide synthase